MVQCKTSENQITLDELCNQESRPADVQSCYSGVCTEVDWMASEWTGVGFNVQQTFQYYIL